MENLLEIRQNTGWGCNLVWTLWQKRNWLMGVKEWFSDKLLSQTNTKTLENYCWLEMIKYSILSCRSLDVIASCMRVNHSVCHSLWYQRSEKDCLRHLRKDYQRRLSEEILREDPQRRSSEKFLREDPQRRSSENILREHPQRRSSEKISEKILREDLTEIHQRRSSEKIIKEDHQ